MTKFVFGRLEGIVGIRENGGHQHYVLLAQCFLKPLLKKPLFLHVYNTSFLKTLWEKEKLLIKSNFSISHSVFNPFGKLSAIFIKLKVV